MDASKSAFIFPAQKQKLNNCNCINQPSSQWSKKRGRKRYSTWYHSHKIKYPTVAIQEKMGDKEDNRPPTATSVRVT
ncbi:hypothetical protein E2C01_013180 [Portunus trituberculatus]|uniref:Uncharacterized protein n=1 Tax=Portunus trituberculatus TaxID=210409 RepID=A0A5B7DGN0_PORTR|nr:hypothetical protein [Portunus trituberculatus]